MSTFDRWNFVRDAAIVFLVVVLLGSTVSRAQLPIATLLGVVKDRSGAVVPEATLTARNVETGQSRTTVSGQDGSYRFSALPVGNYEIEVEHSGFQSETRRGLTLVVGQEAVVNLVLEVGAVEQRVEVTADAPLVNTTSGALGGLVDERKVAELPLNGRNFIDLTLLQPGVQQHKNNRAQSGIAFSSNGAPIRSNNYLLDGASMVSMKGVDSASATGATLGIEGIREYRVVTNSFSAEYGMTMGSQMLIVSKNGTNRFHGSLFEYLRNSALDARNFFDYTSPRRLPAFTRNNFGGSFGGPIKKDSTFFHLVYEGVRERLGLSQVLDVIPPSAKVDGGVVPQIAPVIKPLLALYPDPNLPGNQFTYASTRARTENYGQSRVDQNFSNTDTLFVRYTVDDAQDLTPREFPQFKAVTATRSQFATLSETHILSPTLLNLFRFSYSRGAGFEDDVTDIIGPQVSLVPGLPMGRINIGGVTRFGSTDAPPRATRQNLFTWSDDLFYTRGAHSLKFGTLINRYQQYMLSSSISRGNVTFLTLQDFLLARPSTYSAASPDSIFSRTYHYSTFGFYIQDDWRVRSGLTLNLGLRYEFNTQIQEVTGHGSALRDIQHDARATLGPPMINSSLKNVSPRFGFAWDVTGDSKTAVRGGFGLLYDIGNYSNALLSGVSATPPFSTLSTLVNPPSFTIPLVFPSGPGAVASLTFPDYLMQQPHMLQYNLTVERQLPVEMGVTLGYAGSRGINLTQAKEGNPTIPQVRPDGRQFWLGNEPRTNTNWDTIRLVTAGGNSWYNSLQFGLTKRLSKGLQFQSSYTWSKIIDEGTGQAGSDSTAVSAAVGHDPNSKDRGLAIWDATQNWRFNSIYRLPDLITANHLGKVLRGWWMSGILSLQSGTPFTPAVTANRSRSQNTGGGGTGIDRPDLVLGRKAENIILGGPTRYFDPLAFTVPPIGFLGTAGRNILRDPGTATLDFSLGKDTALGFLGEGGKLEFRAEFFNLLNRVNFGLPNRVVYAARNNVEAPLANAGRITTTATTSREVQFALRLAF
jgi:hypothetical protein